MSTFDTNALVSGGTGKHPGIISSGGGITSPDGIRHRVEQIETQERVQLLRALHRPPAAPPPPVRISFETPGVGAVKLTWRPVDDSRVFGYNVYGSPKNNPNSMDRIGFQPQVPDPRQGQVVYVDTITAGENAFYYVAAVNRAGLESAKVPMHLGTPPNTVAATSARPVYEDEFPPTVIDDTDAGLILRLYSTWRWFEALGVANLIGSTASVTAGYPGEFLYKVSGINQSILLRPYFTSAPNWFKNTDLFDSYMTQYVQWTGTVTDLRFGFIGTATAANPPTDGIYFEKLAADTNWFLVCRKDGAPPTQTRVDTGVAANNAFEGRELFRLRRVDATTIGATVGSGSEVTSTTNIPTANQANLDPFMGLVTGGGAGGTGIFTFDLWRIFFTGLGAKRPPV